MGGAADFLTVVSTERSCAKNKRHIKHIYIVFLSNVHVAVKNGRHGTTPNKTHHPFRQLLSLSSSSMSGPAGSTKLLTPFFGLSS